MRLTPPNSVDTFNNPEPEIMKEKDVLTGLTTIDTGINSFRNDTASDAKVIISLKKSDRIIAHKGSSEKVGRSSNKKDIYVGIMAGPDYSRVGNMAFNNTGIVVGLVAGFYINKRVSLETGISWNKKYYDSEGSSFSMDKVGSSMAGMTVDNLAGQGALVEIPVKARYALMRKENSGFFISGGLSAYIMTKEKNKYNVTMNGNPKKMTGVYNKDSYRLPAAVSLSIGYEHRITPALQIRVEPFLKIPLKGIGIGSLPITSTGLQVGIISRLK